MSSRRLQTGTHLGRDVLRILSDRVGALERAVQLMRPGSPTGLIALYGNASAPSGWVRCNGSLYDGTTAKYVALWGVIGTTYGGTGQSSFAVPNIASVGSSVYIIKL